jgi:small neutral amino acid transporter SnatA (MarC family)
MVAGPGAISTVIIDAQQASIWFDRVFLVLASLLVVVRLTATRRRWP